MFQNQWNAIFQPLNRVNYQTNPGTIAMANMELGIQLERFGSLVPVTKGMVAAVIYNVADRLNAGYWSSDDVQSIVAALLPWADNRNANTVDVFSENRFKHKADKEDLELMIKLLLETRTMRGFYNIHCRLDPDITQEKNNETGERLLCGGLMRSVTGKYVPFAACADKTGKTEVRSPVGEVWRQWLYRQNAWATAHDKDTWAAGAALNNKIINPPTSEELLLKEQRYLVNLERENNGVLEMCQYADTAQKEKYKAFFDLIERTMKAPLFDGCKLVLKNPASHYGIGLETL